ncbi:hypothetical protein GGS24DRAFT_448622 [Hypoxylon argillaceum]|nr:hypothetical protein GGS24DRAFT_448622 [Hypoxylon argillaceum]
MIARGVSKARRSQTKLSKNLQQQLLDVLARIDVESHSNSVQQPPAIEDWDCNALVASSKRTFDVTSVVDSVPAKRRCLTQADARSPIIEGAAEQHEGQGAYVCRHVNRGDDLHHPTPKRPKHSYALFLETFVDLADPIVAWLESSRDIRCRSDSHLCQSSGSPISRLLTVSVPEMGRKVDADEFTLPPTPPLPESPSVGYGVQSDFTGDTSSSIKSSRRSLVENPLYRSTNLATNNIYMRSPLAELPDYITALINDMKKGRDSPEPTLDEIGQDADLVHLEWMGAGRQDVENYFRSKVFPFPGSSDSLRRSDKQPMDKRTVPSTGSQYKVSTPVPDMLYGYMRENAFSGQNSQLVSIGDEAVANSAGLIYPFLVVEFKGDGPPGCGSLWVAANQCLGGSVSCVNMAERLNQRLRQLHGNKVRQINSAIFSVAMNATEARLYVSWKQDNTDFYMVKVEAFMLQRPECHLRFRRYIRNILDWSKYKRLREIQESLDFLLKDKREKAPGVIKFDPSPRLSSASESAKRRSSSPLSTLGNSRTKIIQGQTCQSSDAGLDPGNEKRELRNSTELL